MPSARRTPPWLLAGLLVTADPVIAAEIDPDRPDVTNSARTLRRGAVQIETGLEYARASLGGGESERRFSVQAALRLGITDRLEIGLAGEPLVRLRGAEDDTGHGDLALGGKYRFLDSIKGDAWRPDLGVQPFLKLPIADAPIGSGRPDFGAQLLASFDLPGDVGLDINAGLAVVGQTRPRGYLLQALASASLQRDLIPERLVAFAEIFFASREQRGERDRLSADVGLIYRLTPTLALDAAVETSLAGPAPDYAVRAGVSVRFDR
ncbi:MAG: hypothetical protein AUH29_05165 [Candidatus Rokubacteria bacterium 13_1_40CM_69_27]|nr:MAG: hypothetical protein AUH29_05165 [Candidatus Rokubacteria bacterium 13_1_40CM_69_27]OLC39821.1 MAG: hypothetical protein AUH81_00290 [Candidatus Rokubacteria bacterium 13_1_40CM_4_69_5]